MPHILRANSNARDIKPKLETEKGYVPSSDMLKLRPPRVIRAKQFGTIKGVAKRDRSPS